MDKSGGDRGNHPEAKIYYFQPAHPAEDERIDPSEIDDATALDLITSIWSHPSGKSAAVLESILYHCGPEGVAAAPQSKNSAMAALWRRRVQEILGDTYSPEELQPDPGLTQPLEYAYFLLDRLLETPAGQDINYRRRQRIIRKLFSSD